MLKRLIRRASPSIPAHERVPLGEKLAYAVGQQVEVTVNQFAVSAFLMPVFNIGLGMRPTVLASVMMVFRIWDAMTDPVVGHLSDNTRTRWGRRRPYLVVGAVSTALLLPLLWRPNPAWGEWGMAAYLCGIGILIYSTFTLYVMPYQSLGMELTSNYDERTRINAWVSLVGVPFGLLGAWNLALASSDRFANPATGEPDLVAGVQMVSLLHAALVLILGLIPAFFVKERLYATEVTRQPKEPFWPSIRATLATGPLWALTGIVFFNMLGLSSISVLGYYINVYFVNQGGLKDASIIEGYRLTGMIITSLIAIPFWTWVCERTDKRTALYLVLIGTFAGHALNYFCLRPDLPYLQIVPALFYSAVGSSIWLILPSMRMDVADYDELRTGRRREGSISSVYSWFVKLSGTLSLGVGGLVLEQTGFDAALKTQPPEVLQRMFWTYLLLPVVFWSLSLYALSRFRLNRRTMAAIRGRLQARARAKAQQQAG